MLIHRNLKYLIALAEIKNYRRAAESLHITHSALVRSIKSLEDYYESKLFDRGGGKQVTPTKTGAMVLEYARKISHLEMDMLEDLDQIKGLVRGELSVVFGPYASKMCGHRAVSQLLSKNPGVMVKTTVLHYSKICEAVAERQADIGIAYVGEVANLDDFVTEDLEQHPGVFFCRPEHPLLGRKGLTLTDLIKYPWACNRLPKAYSQFLPANLEKAGKHDPLTGDFVPAVELDLLYEMNEIVASSDVLGMGMLPMFRGELKRGNLAVVPFWEKWLTTQYSIIHLKHRALSSAALVYIEEVRAIEKEFRTEQASLVNEFMGEAAANLLHHIMMEA